LERTFEGITKRKFISIMNDRIFISNWIQHELSPRNNSLCIIARNIGLTFVQSKKTTKLPNSNNHAFYKIIDIPNYNEIIKLFNSLNVISKIGDEYYIVKDNFNQFKKEIKELPFSDYSFKKLSSLTGYKLKKKLK